MSFDEKTPSAGNKQIWVFDDSDWRFQSQVLKRQGGS